MRVATLAAALLLIAPALHAQDEAPAPAKPFTAAETARYTAIGQAATRYFFAGHADSLIAMGDSAFQARVGGVDGIRQQVDMIGERAGMVLNVLDQKMTRRNGTPQFWYEAEMSNFTDEPIVFRWLINEDGKLVGAGMGPKSMARSDPEG
jgi:hypothetical protein